MAVVADRNTPRLAECTGFCSFLAAKGVQMHVGWCLDPKAYACVVDFQCWPCWLEPRGGGQSGVVGVGDMTLITLTHTTCSLFCTSSDCCSGIPQPSSPLSVQIKASKYSFFVLEYFSVLHECCTSILTHPESHRCIHSTNHVTSSNHHTQTRTTDHHMQVQTIHCSVCAM